MKIDIIVDTICPRCYVGKKRFDKALAMRPQDNLKVGWRAFQLNPNMPADGMDRRNSAVSITPVRFTTAFSGLSKRKIYILISME